MQEQKVQIEEEEEEVQRKKMQKIKMQILHIGMSTFRCVIY